MDLSHATVDKDNDDDQTTLIMLPDDNHVLHRWLSRSGSAVRKGETVAYALCKTDATAVALSDAAAAISPATDPLQAPSRAGHKRPMKRSRPTASLPPVTLAGTESEKAETTNQHCNIHSKPSTVPLLAPADGILCIMTSAELVASDNGVSSSLILGRIYPCQHPTILDNLCAVCGAAMTNQLSNKDDQQSLTQHSKDKNNPQQSSNMNRMTVAGLTVSVSQQESQRMAQQDAQRLQKLGKLSLVLDLDHTLVHATSDPRAADHLHREDVRSILLPLTEDAGPVMHGNVNPQQRMQHFLKFRPHLKTFFERLDSIYEIGVYTAGTREYAEQVCMVIARMMVGAMHDQVHMMDLQHRIGILEYELHKSRRENDDAGPSGGVADETFAMDESETKITGDGEAANATNKDAAEDASEEPKAKRRKVTFGETPAECKSDHATEQQLVELRNELLHAERLERLAIEMRQKLFGSRIVSRTDVGDLGRDVKCLKRIFPCGGSMAVVVDDREDVWARAQGVIFANRPGEPPDNLLLVRPYHWDTFRGFADVNNAAAVDLSTLGNGESRHRSDLDLQLLWTCNTLVRLHETYYDNIRTDTTVTVPRILAEMRQQVLAQSHIVLSGLVPLHHQQRPNDTNQPRPPFIRYVESLGATYQTTPTDTTTHVVASKDGTDKILNARKLPGCFIVRPSWLMECVWSMTRRSEQAHLLGPPPQPVSNSAATVKAPLTDTTKTNSSSSEDDEDDDDDDFAEELEKEMMNR